MKLSLLPVLIIVTAFSMSGSIYDIKIQPIEGGSAISLSAFAGKKILITTINSINLDTTRLLFLDSLQRTNASSLLIIAVPAGNIREKALVGNDSKISKLKISLPLRFFITPTAMVTKSSGKDQHPLFRWLTNVSENRHFDVDVTTGQIFIVSSTGILYSVLPGNVSAHFLSGVLEHEVTQ
jgi:glutathione peroxidase-family protein